jgi:hypothetical protein
LDADLRTGQRVTRIGHDAGGLTVTTAAGQTLRARAVVAAAGGFGAPYRAPLAGLDRFTGPVLHSAQYRRVKVCWPDGPREVVDAVILAIGYRPTLAFLTGTAALDAAGRPRHRGGVSSTVPGLGYVGLEWQRSVSSATVRGVGRDAGHVLARLRVGGH